VKELTEIQNKGTPDGIAPLDLESGDGIWIFAIQVLGDETVYRVSSNLYIMASCDPRPSAHSDSGRDVRVAHEVPA
jgi:hypothetical protein